MNVLKYLLLIIISLTLGSCISVRFENPQPIDADRITEFPGYLAGVYSSEENDTLQIRRQSFKYKEDTVDISGKVSAEEFVLKQLGNFYVLSIQSNDIWDVYLLKKVNDSINVFSFQFDRDKTDDLLDELNRITQVKQVKDEDGELDYLLVNPTGSEFSMMISSGIISNSIEFTLIEEGEE
ncbi:MAG: hypothetical protein ACLFNU_03925 [Bacteroidales bacterium]